MNKINVLIYAALLLMILSSCSKKDDSPGQPEEKPPVTAPGIKAPPSGQNPVVAPPEVPVVEVPVEEEPETPVEETPAEEPEIPTEDPELPEDEDPEDPPPIELPEETDPVEEPEVPVDTSDSTKSYRDDIQAANKEILESTGLKIDLTGLTIVVFEIPKYPVTCGEVKASLSGKKTITISASQYKALSQEKRMAVLIHTLGHCYLGLEHTESSSQWKKLLEVVLKGRKLDLMNKQVCQGHVDKNHLTKQKRSPYIKWMVWRAFLKSN